MKTEARWSGGVPREGAGRYPAEARVRVEADSAAQSRTKAGFSASRYGFRSGTSADQAVQAARDSVVAGYRSVVSMDLEKFFDREDHDLLMGKLADQVEDTRILKLIRRYLEAGMMADGVVSPRREGMPQGGPLSPLLSNILLTEVDRELEHRGHRFRRFADDCNMYIKSAAAGLGGRLPTDYRQGAAGGALLLDMAQSARTPVAAMQTPRHPRPEPDASGPDGGTGLPLGHQRARPVVEQRGQSHARRLPEGLL